MCSVRRPRVKSPKGEKYTLLLDGGLRKMVPVADLGNNRRPSP